ncbi:M12 family metallo-peptidase [Dyadobacter sp. CY261]|uniref:M12 family metallo-peptidase n=1 Tax=Dyadobacter sp. CY261 TaxID=2907203 RepID=UPI001F4092F6|nr:M12 family metallo-peptidase [Dyadobacter sp. CY261]MCF0072201.1 M12 family metallo-peptidase [Dyadobacter sp. CY261]
MYQFRFPKHQEILRSGGWMTYIIMACLLFAFQNAIGQQANSTTSLFSLASQDDLSKISQQRAGKIQQMERTGLYKQVLPVKIGDLAKIQKKGVLTFNIPGSSEELTYYARQVDVESETEFKWMGVSKDEVSTALFICEKGQLFGAFRFNNRHFQVFTLENGISVLQEDRNDLEAHCDADKGGFALPDAKDPAHNDQDENARMGVCSEPMRVFVAYTAAAASAVANIGQTITLSVQQYNQTIDNSGATELANKITLAGTQLVTFSSNSPETAASAGEAAARLRDNATIQNLRNQFNADLVIGLIDANFGGTVGSVITIPADNTNYCAVVLATASSHTASYTFTHELGHLVGGRHEGDTNPPAYSHGYKFGANRTMMHTFDILSNRIMYFSNPYIQIAGTPIGTPGTNHVARVISETSWKVVNFRPSVGTPFHATIDGPSGIGSSGNYRWELLYFCRNIVSTTWQYSFDGFTYNTYWGGGDMMDYYVNESQNGSLFLRCVIITDQAQTYTTSKTVNVNICPGCRTTETPVTQSESETAFYSVSPNPANNKIKINYSISQKSDIHVELFDLLGRSHISKPVKDVPSGNHTEHMDISKLTSGLYICRLTHGGKTISKPFVVTK